MPDSRPFLRKVDLFADFSDAEMQALAGMFQRKDFETGARIVEEGETADSFFIIESGQVQVFRGVKNSYLAQLTEGQYFGEAALFQDIRRTASVEADGPVRALVITREAFDRFVSQEPRATNRVLRRIIKSLVLKLERTSVRLDKSSSPDADDAEIERMVLDDLGLMRWKI
jgi:CRP-like cAMP-binding protein